MGERTCSIEGCMGKPSSKGWCDKHYSRWRRHGDPTRRDRHQYEAGATCSIGTCGNPILARSLCGTHYQRWRANGAPGEAAIRPMLPREGECSVEGCARPRQTRGLCSTHYARFRVHGDPGPAEINVYRSGPCTVEGCSRKTCGQGLCGMHYERKRKTGDIGPAGPLRNASGDGTTSYGYRAVTVAKGKIRLEHRVIMEKLIGRPLLRSETVHHVNGQRADNTTTGSLDENYRSGNLELWSSWQPAGQRVVDKVQYAVELLQRYAPERLATGASAANRRTRDSMENMQLFQSRG